MIALRIGVIHRDQIDSLYTRMMFSRPKMPNKSDIFRIRFIQNAVINTQSSAIQIY